MARTMLALSETMAHSTLLLVVASLAGALLAPAVARAQTTTVGPTITPAGTIVPKRLLPDGTTAPSRPVNLNPNGINYNDCISDLALQFTVEVSGFTGADTLEIWASNVGDCIASTARGNAAIATCWEVSQGEPGIVASSGMTRTYTIKVRDIVGPQNAPPASGGFAQTERQGELLGAGACATQPSFLGVPMFITFLAVGSNFASDGNPYVYGSSTTSTTSTTTTATAFIADLIGPPAPVGVTKAVGDSFFIANWTPNVDSDTAGYDLFIDPIPGQEDASASAGSATQTTVCPDSSTTTVSDSGDDVTDSGDDGTDSSDGAIDSSDDGGATDATSSGASSGDAGCYTVTTAGPPATTTNSVCDDSVLASGFVQDSGTTSTEVLDEAGNVIDASVVTGVGGNSTVPCANLVGGCGSTNATVSSNATGTYSITGLKNGTTYNVVVAAVDGSGNIGPPSAEVCDFPAPVNDFWTLYRNSGGRAGGGFCALEAVGEPVPSAVGGGMILGAGVLAMRRRRSRRRVPPHHGRKPR